MVRSWPFSLRRVARALPMDTMKCSRPIHLVDCPARSTMSCAGCSSIVTRSQVSESAMAVNISGAPPVGVLGGSGRGDDVHRKRLGPSTIPTRLTSTPPMITTPASKSHSKERTFHARLARNGRSIRSGGATVNYACLVVPKECIFGV